MFNELNGEASDMAPGYNKVIDKIRRITMSKAVSESRIMKRQNYENFRLHFYIYFRGFGLNRAFGFSLSSGEHAIPYVQTAKMSRLRVFSSPSWRYSGEP